MKAKTKSELYREIGFRIRSERERQGLTQTDLTEKLDISRTSLVNIELGRQQAPLYTLWDVAAALDLEVADLLPTRKELAPKATQVVLDSEIKKLIRDKTESGQSATKLAEFVASVKSESSSNRSLKRS